MILWIGYCQGTDKYYDTVRITTYVYIYIYMTFLLLNILIIFYFKFGYVKI